MKTRNMTDKLEVPGEVEITAEHRLIVVKGPNGELNRKFLDPKIKISVKDSNVLFSIDIFTKKEKTLLGTYKAHILNMIKGVTQSHEYKMKICSGHFPMNVSFNNHQFQVKNFLGEKIPRVLNIKENVDLKIDGDKINLKGIDKELVAQTAASIEQLTRRTRFDKRVFQDGIYIVNKDGKEIK